jgi:hypothetical protein
MSVERKRPDRGRKDRLDFWARSALACGDYHRYYASSEARREAYFAHRDELLSEFIDVPFEQQRPPPIAVAQYDDDPEMVRACATYWLRRVRKPREKAPPHHLDEMLDVLSRLDAGERGTFEQLYGWADYSRRRGEEWKEAK